MAGLGNYPVEAIIRAEDFDRAAKFYSEVLGLAAVRVSGPTREGRFRAGSGTTVAIYERPGMPAPENTTLSFTIPPEEFDAVIADLRTRGVVFEDYDIPEIGLKTVDGIAEMEEGRAAWFKDTEGNIVAIGA